MPSPSNVPALLQRIADHCLTFDPISLQFFCYFPASLEIPFIPPIIQKIPWIYLTVRWSSKITRTSIRSLNFFGNKRLRWYGIQAWSLNFLSNETSGESSILILRIFLARRSFRSVRSNFSSIDHRNFFHNIILSPIFTFVIKLKLYFLISSWGYLFFDKNRHKTCLTVNLSVPVKIRLKRPSGFLLLNRLFTINGFKARLSFWFPQLYYITYFWLYIVLFFSSTSGYLFFDKLGK